MTVLAPRASGTATATPTRAAPATPSSDTEVDALALWDDNGNGRITCAEARAHGIAPVHRGHPAYHRAFSFSCLVGKAHHVESFAEMGIVAA